jgi:triacylglycerol esterase/lipase EstA (alpha/beta hydrolase family)
LVHGLFRNGWEMALLRLRLAAVGYRMVQFTYPTVRLSPEKNAKDLQAFIDRRVETETLHFVAHSLGGLVIRYLFHDFPKQRPGRIVTVGTPHQGSSIAAGLRIPFLAVYCWARVSSTASPAMCLPGPRDTRSG